MASTSESVEKTWVGTSMEDIYRGHGPWGFEIPPVSASRFHAILYQLPATLKHPPKPHVSAQVHHWDDDHVRMPFSEKNVFTIEDENGEKILKQRWELIQESLLQPINSSKELEAVICTYNTRLPKFLALHHFFEELLEEEETQLFFESLLPGIIRLALRLPDILPGSIPLLKQGACRSISLSQLQIASLLANGFLCTFPYSKDSFSLCPGANFVRLFAAHLRPKREQAVAEKLKSICHYFRRVLVKEPVGVVTFERKHFPKSQLPRWDRWENNLGNTRIHISSTGVIEDDGHGLLQVDFANKNVGGGVLGFGCVQEEIRYIICPELIISRLFTEQLGPTEALVITGAERYSQYTGYGDSFEWAGDYQDQTPYDNSGRRRTSIAAIDALRFTKPAEQYFSSCILRELNKAYVGFHSRYDGQLPAVATGNWGCGAFRGDPSLKSLIQLMACSAARRDMVYFTFDNTTLRDNIHEMYLFLATNQITIVQLWRYLCRFSSANLKAEHLFSYIQQAHFDSKGQLSIKSFFSFNKKKMDKNKPSTSNVKLSPIKNSPSTSDVTDRTPVKDNSDLTSNWEEEIMVDISPISSQNSENNCDVIESSQPEEDFKKPLPKGLQQFKRNMTKSENNSHKKKEINSEEVLYLIDLIDGKSWKRENTEKDDNRFILSSLDKFSRKSKDEETKLKEQVVVEMELSEDIEDEEEILKKQDVHEMEFSEEVEDDEIINTSIEGVEASSSVTVVDDTAHCNESMPKRKITDYFTKIKMDKG